MPAHRARCRGKGILREMPGGRAHGTVLRSINNQTASERKSYFSDAKRRKGRLHGVMGHGCVPYTPERPHLFREAQRNSNVLRESRKSGGHQNTLGAKDLRDFVARAADGHEHEIRLRIEPTKHARVGLIEKLLAMIFVERGNFLD